jgi:midasin (ATPase involved in ribosome maturation)
LGCYTCSEKIGEFEWKSGPLFQAITEGCVLVIKNMQEASEEVI